MGKSKGELVFLRIKLTGGYFVESKADDQILDLQTSDITPAKSMHICGV